MKKYILLIRNIHTPDEAYGPYPSMDGLRLHLYQLYGDDWIYQNFQSLELKSPEQLSRKECDKGIITSCLE